MRWPEAKILEAILHPEWPVRQVALRYFTDSFSPDPAVMPRVIQTLDTYGREEAFPFRFGMTGLVQSERTIDWAIQELRQIQPHPFSQYFSALCHMLAEADSALLEPRRQEILALPHFEPGHLSTLNQRLELAGWDADQCWRELESMCDAAVQDPDECEFDWQRSDQLAEVVGRQGQVCADRVLELLADPAERELSDPVQWMETFLVQVAGYLRLEAAIPSLIARLRREDDFLPEECAKALTRIGTDAVIEEVTKRWHDEPRSFRSYASDIFSGLHGDFVVARVPELLPGEPELFIKTNMALGLLGNFATEGVEPVRQLIKNDQYDSMYADLPRDLVAVATVMEMSFPELETWKQEAERRATEVQRRLRQMNSMIRTPQPPAPPRAEPGPVPFVRAEERVGRNDACPCGSGKKFKKCCLTKSRV